MALVVALSGLGAVLAAQARGFAEASPEVGFARDMHTHHGQAVVMSLLVRERGSDPEVAALARDILTGQAEEQGVMLGWLREHEVPASTVVAPMAWMPEQAGDAAAGGHGASTGSGAHGDQGRGHVAGAGTATGASAGTDTGMGPGMGPGMGMATDEELSELGSLSGTSADLLYVQLMRRHHEGAVVMAEVFGGLSDEPALSALSEGVLTTQHRELRLLAAAEERLTAAAQAG